MSKCYEIYCCKRDTMRENEGLCLKYLHERYRWRFIRDVRKFHVSFWFVISYAKTGDTRQFKCRNLFAMNG